MKTWAFFRDGVFTGDSVTSSTKPDDRDGLELREVDVLPPHPLPPDDELRTWSRRADGLLVATLTLAGQKLEASNAVKVRLAALDLAIARPVGEIAEAQALGDPLPDASVARLRAINAGKQALRERLAAISGTETADELLALLAEPVPEQPDSDGPTG